jgi:hypothetical protein
MKFMFIMRDTAESLAASKEIDFNEMLDTMGAYNDALMKAGVFLTAEGLSDPSEGVVVDFSAEQPIATDGPYGETHELFNGFWMIQVSSKEEAIEWAKRCPLGPGSKLEVRRVNEWADFEGFEDNEYVQRAKEREDAKKS